MMKHNLRIIAYLMVLFFTTQIVGLYLLNQSIETVEQTPEGDIEVVYSQPITGRPELEGQSSFSYILAMVLVGTAILLVIIKLRLFRLWKLWFFLAIWGALSISFSVFLDDMLSAIISFVLAYIKIYKPNAVIHNMTEVLIYPGIAIIISPMFNLFWAAMLLIAISIYDMIAVWKSKHMITLAEAQSDNEMFAGLMIPYKSETKTKKAEVKIKISKNIKGGKTTSAILGGGDVAFPMIFAGSVMTFLIEAGISKEMAFFRTLPISLFAGAALFLLFIKSEKGKFYPAMPFISIGCFIGYGIVLLL